MADENSESNERTQDPTPRRLEEALNRGDVVKSIEVNTWFTMAGGTLAMMIFAVPMASSLQTTFRGLLARSYQIPTDGPGLNALAKTLVFDVVGALGVPLLIVCVAAFAGNIVQHRIVFTTDLIMPKMSRPKSSATSCACAAWPPACAGRCDRARESRKFACAGPA
jgi:flagellar biosynthesis protein FlhB